MDQKQRRATAFAFLAAVFYAINVPLSKVLLQDIAPTMMAALLYLGAGIGIGIVSACKGKPAAREKLSRSDLPFVVGMILLDIAAPIFLMMGIRAGSSSGASLLGNFEIVATAVIALFLFRERVSCRLWAAIALITISSMLLSLNGGEGISLSIGSVYVLLATICWGFENNCTRRISSKDTYEIVFLKGIFSGAGSLGIALMLGEPLPRIPAALLALLLGFVAYGLSIFLYVRAQNTLGAAKTSAYYAVNPFVGALLSFVFLHEPLSGTYFAALVIMLAGSVLVVLDTMHAEKSKNGEVTK